ncbi:TIGR03790 family protein [Thiocapsa imhoffii]|uniref:TIGR03790 family protein n=2 Tax=Thiocapsa imhoffii TaxID=382777 RepID=A0A9X0WIQ9_9GAMM|nr:TIGR03790 family protein [Thiocapsa imhoffii]
MRDVLPIGLLILGLAVGQVAAGQVEPPRIELPRQALGPEDLAVIINDLDPTSQQIADYFVKRRNIPSQNLIHIRFKPGDPVMDLKTFERIDRSVRAATPAGVQAYVLTWTLPYRVGCMSMTSAFAAGYDEAFCATGCRPTRASAYFASGSDRPYTDFGIRPTIALAGETLADVQALIDRGVAADNTLPSGTGYLVNTTDSARTVRATTFARTIERLGGAVQLARIDADAIENKDDVLFYLTGLVSVPKLDTNRFLPGALADHLTSTGGQLIGSGQMSSLRWLEAGATGSYGTVVEPCNLLDKFPHPTVLIGAYVTGSTLIEAYWKSVRMPGQGMFIGEPLARPFGGYRLVRDGANWHLTVFALRPGRYALQAAEDPIGPYRDMAQFEKVGFQPVQLTLPAGGLLQVRIQPITPK